jgi:hypothetical protein
MKKCGVPCHSTVDVDFNNLSLVRNNALPLQLYVRASQIPQLSASFD